ncbi:MAG: hypothetical protein D8M59_02420 [Planctomycetes bacterium]|nr:hypothetical protein [Planctomycetota bacterium]
MICHEDCSGKPRVKDNQGRYYCRTCFDDAKRAAAARREAERIQEQAFAVTDPTEPDASPIFDDLDVPDQPQGQGYLQLCPSCRQQLPAEATVCVDCGIYLATGKAIKVKKEKKRKKYTRDGEPDRSMVDYCKSPFALAIALLVFFGLYFWMARSNESLAVSYIGVASIFSLASGILILVSAFMTSVTQGLLSLCVPCYVIYYIAGVCENTYLQVLFLVNVLVSASLYTFPQYSSLVSN